MTIQVLDMAEGAKLDANLNAPGSAVFFRRELEFVFTKTYEKDLPPLTGLDLFHVDTSVDEGAETYTFQMYESSGVAEFISASAKDLPSIDVSAREETANIRMIGLSYAYSIQDIAAAKLANRPLDAMRASATRRADAEKHNRICWYGSTAKGLRGVIGYKYAPRENFPVAISDLTADPMLIVNAMNNAIYGIMRRTNGARGKAKTLVFVLPTEEFTHIQSRRIGDGTDTTIGEFVANKNSSLAKFEHAPELRYDVNDALNPLTVNQRFGFIYDPDPDVISYVMPKAFTMMPAQFKTLCFTINTYSRSGGICMKYPLATVLLELLPFS